MGDVWKSGMFSVPHIIAENYIKLASEYQLKALLLILSDNGRASAKEIAKALGCTQSDADDFLEFWVDEGILLCDSDGEPSPENKESKKPRENPKKEKEERSKAEEPKESKAKALETIPVPTLSPKDVVLILHESSELAALLQSAQEVLGRTLSHNENALIINMVQYYGLPCEVALTIIQYYKREKDSGRAIGNAYLGAMAKNWSEEGIITLDAAEEKLRELESSDKLWKEILSMCSLGFRNPTVNQREMIKSWADDFPFEMIAYACELMRENAQSPGLRYVKKILANWKDAGITTLEQAKAAGADFKEKNSSKSKPNKLKGSPSFDITEIEKKALFDDDYNV